MHVDGFHGAQAITIQEHEAPVAHAHPVAQREAYIFRRVQAEIDRREYLRTRALDFRVGHGFGGRLFHERHELIECRVDGLLGAHLYTEAEHAGFRKHECGRKHRRRLACFDQRFVEPPSRRVCEYLTENLQRGKVFVNARWNVVPGGRHLYVALTAQDHAPLAVLRRLDGMHFRQGPRGTRDASEVLLHERQCRGFIDLPGDQQQRVVGLIVGSVEGLQTIDGHAFDIRACADRQFAVVVPIVGHGQQPFEHHGAGLVFAAFELVAHHRHLAVESFLGDE